MRKKKESRIESKVGRVTGMPDSLGGGRRSGKRGIFKKENSNEEYPATEGREGTVGGGRAA